MWSRARTLANWLAGTPVDARALVAIGAMAVVLRLWPLAGGSAEYDEGVYWQSLRALAAGHALFSDVFSSQPPGFLLLLYPFYLLFGQSLVAARLAVALYALIGLVALYAAGRAIGGRWAGALACAFVALDPLALHAAVTLQAEGPSLAFQVACIALAAMAARADGRRRSWLALASGAALGLGVMTKLWDVVVIAPALLYLAAPALRTGWSARETFQRPEPTALRGALRQTATAIGLFVAGASATLLALLAPFASRWSAMLDQVVTFHLAVERALGRGLWANLGAIARTWQEYALALAACLAITFAVRQRDWRIAPPVAWLLASLLTLARQQPLFDHHHALLTAPLALTAAVGLTAALEHPASLRLRYGARALVGLALASGLVVGVFNDQMAAQSPTADQTRLAATMARMTAQGDIVASDDQFIAGLAGRSVPPPLVDTSFARIASSYLTAQQIEDAITNSDAQAMLFASGRFASVPGLADWAQTHFARRVDLGAGRALYVGRAPPATG